VLLNRKSTGVPYNVLDVDSMAAYRTG